MFKKRNYRFTGLLVVFAILMVLSLVLFLERKGIQYQTQDTTSYLLDKKQAITKTESLENLTPTNLAIYDSTDENSASALSNFKQIFEDMRVATTYVDISKESLPGVTDYQTVSILTPNIEPLGDQMLTIMDWVSNGGNIMFAMTIQKDSVAGLIEQKIGIDTSTYANAEVKEVYIEKGFMLGSGQSYKVENGYDSAWSVGLSEDAKVYMRTADSSKVPLVWTYDLGQGRVVVDNFGIYEQAMRGFYAASYSLLTDVGIYPVINSSAFTLDDFPSPVPSGDATYISRDYNMSVSDFYTNIWWPDMVDLADKYGLHYTGVIIENYEDDTSGSKTRQDDTSRFTYFGNQLLQMGGEIGYHGYNHQPLSLPYVDYNGEFTYKKWKNEAAMKSSLDELVDFTHYLFPGIQTSVYVPPSNILSKEARELLAKDYPEIRVIASSYMTLGHEYAQEFGVADDGIVEEPRISSGTVIDDYIKMTMVSELNLHLVSHHFVHPDDPLDVERGAKLGWEKMYKNLSNQYEWLYKAAPMIRNQTESDMGGSIQRFSSVNVVKTVSEDDFTFKIDHLVDEAYFMIRINDGEVGKVTGGELEKIEGNLYLLRATNKKVTIARTK
ncbi:DUF2194 domain-containing protein [Streptococcus loxodontisalivarius]|uniref:DUF2194 domain-containing protein n=1 Tax=Streptococcus loxodontisalivarius TaxID=1349415 RepID=A0ABS2PUF5_9STRE|nr:DUF2194 domain-containing protein [Streptococcus loxodontisalivarius]MBM7642967.1 hypothetical protein [Streptococcus loxodontisalivarius]